MEIRIGEGWDIHALVEGRPLVLGGVRIPYDKGLLGHSDADALLHALTDALLGPPRWAISAPCSRIPMPASRAPIRPCCWRRRPAGYAPWGMRLPTWTVPWSRRRPNWRPTRRRWPIALPRCYTLLPGRSMSKPRRLKNGPGGRGPGHGGTRRGAADTASRLVRRGSVVA